MNWRQIETIIVDHVHRRERGTVIDVCGRAHIAAEFFDADDGRLLEQKILIEVAALAKAIEDSI